MHVHGSYADTVQVTFFFSSRRRHTRLQGDWSSDVCSSDLSSSDIEGSAAMRRNRDAPASSDKRSSLVTCSTARKIVLSRYATSKPSATITSITNSRGKNSANMCTRLL